MKSINIYDYLELVYQWTEEGTLRYTPGDKGFDSTYVDRARNHGWIYPVPRTDQYVMSHDGIAEAEYERFCEDLVDKDQQFAITVIG
jgi:hypothetical protein